MTMADVTAEERREAAKLIEPIAFGKRTDGLTLDQLSALQDHALSAADRFIAAGWRPSPPVDAPSPSARVATWMITQSYATGHGDTIENMLAELEAQAKERGAQAVEQPQPEAVRALVEEARSYRVSSRITKDLINRLAGAVEILAKLQEPKA